MLASSEAYRRALARLVAVAGHDLKQPLQVAMLSVARATEGGLPADAARRLRTALDALRRLSGELDDIARLSQQGDALRVRRRIVLLDEIADVLGRDWGDYAQGCGIELRVQLPSLYVETDPAMLCTILRNLIGNALKSSGPGGQVVVACHARGGQLSIDVHDTGPGIAPDRLGRIFDAFERGEGAGSGDGLGLGLTIVRQTAQMLGHRISVRSVVSEGSTFSVELPCFGGPDRPAVDVDLFAADWPAAPRAAQPRPLH